MPLSWYFKKTILASDLLLNLTHKMVFNKLEKNT